MRKKSHPFPGLLLVLTAVATSGAALAASPTATYLDRRAAAWAVSSDSRCAMSCHTTYPYLVARPLLPPSEASALERVRGAIEARVRAWDDATPWYSSYDGKSRSTEAVLNAAALTQSDANLGRGTLTPVARAALDAMWSQQRADGGWDWLDVFGLYPWEASDAEYWGVAQAALAVGAAPRDYQAVCRAGGEREQNCAAMRRYLRAPIERTRTQLSLHNSAALLLASAKLQGLLSAAEQRTIVQALERAQARDGSWSVSALSGSTQTQQAGPSTYATAYALYALTRAGVPREATSVSRARAWLEARRGTDGAWAARSVNRPDRDFNAQLATDAATAYAVMALTK